jgi:broad specificity phosphatase PhoE
MHHTESSSLVLLRHGESEWNARNLFTGWVNAPLTGAGERAATQAGRLLAQEGLWPDMVHTSVLQRAIRTADLALAACDRDWVPARRSWRLNATWTGSRTARWRNWRYPPPPRWSTGWTRTCGPPAGAGSTWASHRSTQVEPDPGRARIAAAAPSPPCCDRR